MMTCRDNGGTGVAMSYGGGTMSNTSGREGNNEGEQHEGRRTRDSDMASKYSSSSSSSSMSSLVVSSSS